jgi:predicted transposase YbfD/YdcC
MTCLLNRKLDRRRTTPSVLWLKALILEGRIVTMDALLTQKDVARDIRAKGGTSSDALARS